MFISFKSPRSLYIDMNRDDHLSSRVVADRVIFDKFEVSFFLNGDQILFLPRPCSFVISYYDDDNHSKVIFRNNRPALFNAPK